MFTTICLFGYFFLNAIVCFIIDIQERKEKQEERKRKLEMERYIRELERELRFERYKYIPVDMDIVDRALRENVIAETLFCNH